MLPKKEIRFQPFRIFSCKISKIFSRLCLLKIFRIVRKNTLKRSKPIIFSDNNKILLTTRNVRLNRDHYATKYHFLAIDTKWTRIYFVWILTCCTVFQFESSSSTPIIRIKMKEELVPWRCLARRQGITTMQVSHFPTWISQHGWCVWISIINS